MAGEVSNPYKQDVTKPVDEEKLARLKPFRRPSVDLDPYVQNKMLKVRDLDLVSAKALDSVSRTVTELTVRDLEDMADEFSGIETNNPKIRGLSVEDIQDLEGLFFEYKRSKIGVISGIGGNPGLAMDNVSSCCCTPCCCCAAVDNDPFSDSRIDPFSESSAWCS